MSHRQLIVCGSLLIVSVVACWFFPLFHVRPMKSGASLQRHDDTQDKGEIRKLDAYATGTEVKQLWNAFDADKSKAQSQYGRQAGLGGAWYFRVQGEGVVDSIENHQVVVVIDDSPRRVCLEMGVVVDNTVREAVGVKASDFANSQDFNAVSTELNRQVEQEVIAPNRERLKPGAAVQFVGCAKIAGKSDLDPLRLIPIRLMVDELANQSQAGSCKQDAHSAEKSP